MIDGFRFRLASAATDISRLAGSLRKSIAAELLAGHAGLPLIEFPRLETEPNVKVCREKPPPPLSSFFHRATAHFLFQLDATRRSKNVERPPNRVAFS